MSHGRLPQVIEIGEGIAARFAAFCAARGPSPLRLVADGRTWAALGEAASRALEAAGLPWRSTIFEELYLAADANSVLRLLVDDRAEERLYVAIGSGTITDIVRFVCDRTGREFISLPTAPSVDAYSSVVVPLVIGGMKRTFPASAPLAVFADRKVLAAAPKPMIAAGFGDMICKFSAVADWRLGALLWNESFDEALAQRSVGAARSCVAAAPDIAELRPQGVETLMAALVDSGLCMALAGHSRPASGAEHQYSHYWEMRLLRDGRPPILHGLKVGVGSLETARLWEKIGKLDQAEAESRLVRSRPPLRAGEEARIQAAYGELSAEVKASQERFLSMGEAEYGRLVAKILDSWHQIQELAASVPSADETRRLLALVGCPTDARELGLGEEEIALGLDCAHYLRDRFTVKKLSLMLGG